VFTARCALIPYKTDNIRLYGVTHTYAAFNAATTNADNHMKPDSAPAYTGT